MARGRHFSLEWLDKQEKKSVLYVSFGTTTTLTNEQIKQLAIGLEASKQKFIWVLRDADKGDNSNVRITRDEEYLKGFEERVKVKGNGLIVRDWAPQLEILSHGSTGGFMSHCGWNSVLEAVVAGVPIIAWPLHAEQHMNRNLLVEDMKMAIGLEHREEDEFVKGEELEKKVRELMASEKGKEMRERSFKMRDLAESARGHFGSSTKALNKLIETWNRDN